MKIIFTKNIEGIEVPDNSITFYNDKRIGVGFKYKKIDYSVVETVDNFVDTVTFEFKHNILCNPVRLFCFNIKSFKVTRIRYEYFKPCWLEGV